MALWKVWRVCIGNNPLQTKEMIQLTNEETKSYEDRKDCHIWIKEFITDKNDEKTFKIYH